MVRKGISTVWKEIMAVQKMKEQIRAGYVKRSRKIALHFLAPCYTLRLVFTVLTTIFQNIQD